MAIFEVYSEQAILNDNGYTHEQLGQHTHEELGEHTHIELNGAELPKLRHLAGWDEDGLDLKNLKLQYTQSNTIPGSICVFIREGKECFYTFNNEYEWVRGSGGEGVTPGTIYTAGKNIEIEDDIISLDIPVVSESDEDSIANDTYFSEIVGVTTVDPLYATYADIETLTESVNILDNSVDSLAASVLNNSRGIENLSSSIIINYDNIEDLKSSVTNLDDDIENLITSVSNNNTSIGNLTTSYNNLNSSVSNNYTNIQNLITLYENLNSSISNNRIKIENLANSVSNNSTAIEDLRSSVSAIYNNIERLMTSVSNNTTYIENVASSVSNNTTYIGDVASSVSNNSANIEDLMSSISLIDRIFVGTQTEWENLTLEEKLAYTQVNITDD